ncbi:MAG TPA: bacterial transcriptional activator domain-containing protein [Longimicrobium sp.]
MLLKTLGHPALHRADGALVGGLRRKKDLALLVYLCVEGLPVHARGRLAGLLWGDSPNDRAARHSLTQAVGRLLRVLPGGVLDSDKDAVRWSGGLPCDAVRLLREGLEPEEVDDAFSLYGGDFVEGFDPGPGAQEFREWADRRRAELRNAAVRLLDRASEQAEAGGSWERARELSERAVMIDPLWEQGHRRIMRALAARGERNLALRHYQELEAYLAEEVGGRPDPDTRALAERLRAPDPAPSHLPPPAPPPVPNVAAGPKAASEPAPGPPPKVETEPDLTRVSAGAGLPDPPAATHDPAALAALAGLERTRPRPPRARVGRRTSRWLWIALAAATAALAATLARDRWRAHAALSEPPPAHGESVRVRGSRRVFLAFGKTLYQYPDTSTLCVCTGWHPEVVREVSRLPRWPRRMLPSVRAHGWLGASLPVVSDHPQDKTAYVPVGCILPGVPDQPTLDSIFGSNALGRMLEVPDSVLARLPRAFIARGHPLRLAGTVIRGPEGGLRWITYHGGALEVEGPALLATYCRSPAQAVPVSAREFRYYRPWGRLAPGPGRCPPSPQGRSG